MKKILTMMLSVLLLVSFDGIAAIPAPQRCPQAAVMKQSPIYYADCGYFGCVVFGDSNAYGTDVEWKLSIAFIDVSSPRKAITIANNKLLPMLRGNPEPIGSPSEDSWICIYEVEGETAGFAIYPPRAMNEMDLAAIYTH